MTSGDAAPSEVERLFTEPIQRLQRILERGEAQLEARRVELAEVRYALFELATSTSRQERTAGSGAIEHLSAEMAPPLLRYLLDQTTDIVRVCTLSVGVGAGVEQENIRFNQDLLVQGRFRQQTIYPMDIMDSEDGRAWVHSFAAAGEEQRLSLGPPSEFAVFDQRAVVAVAGWGDLDSDYVMVRDPMLIAAFTALFDRAFQRALPATPGDALDDVDVRLVRLLGLGLKDESIARYLGCSLRTVRRRVAHLMERHGVQTRFQLGVSVARDGLASPDGGSDR